MTAREVLDGIRGRLTAATPGPWAVDEDEDGFDGHSVYQNDGITWGRAYICQDMHQGEDEGKADATFIAAAPMDVARLVAAVEGVLGLADKWWANFPSKARDIEAAIEAALKEGE